MLNLHGNDIINNLNDTDLHHLTIKNKNYVSYLFRLIQLLFALFMIMK